jgi:hypothetical protein
MTKRSWLVYVDCLYGGSIKNMEKDVLLVEANDICDCVKKVENKYKEFTCWYVTEIKYLGFIKNIF